MKRKCFRRYPGGSSNSSKSSFLQSLNPARWGRSMNASHDRTYNKDSLNNLSKSSSNSHITAGNREKTRAWIREQANKFIDSYSSKLQVSSAKHSATVKLCYRPGRGSTSSYHSFTKTETGHRKTTD